MLTPPQLPLSIRLANAAMGAMQPFGFQRRHLDKNALMDAARQKTGLEDFGEPTFEAGLEHLLADLRDKANLTPLGRIIAREETVMTLVNRLQVIDHHKRFPEMGRQSIDQPIFIIGQGRSGTTVMHELLALDPQFRVPLTWEVDFPTPPPETATYTTDPRISEVQKSLDRSDSVLPDFRNMHRMGATLPQECVRFTTGEFMSLIYWTTYDVPTYSRWLKEEADMTAAYRYHRAYLELLQWKHRRSPWVVKSPAHLWSLGELLAEYPDARFIQTHRDPLRMLASLTSLVTHLRKMASNAVDVKQIAIEWAEWNAHGLNASAEFRSSGAIPDDRVIDVDFYKFMEDPLTEMDKIYAGFNLDFAPEIRQKMQDYLRENSAEKHGGHRYTFEDTGLNAAEERARLEPYQDYFNTRIEIK